MSDERSLEWTTGEARLLASLPREDAPPPGEADTILSTFRAEHRRPSRWVRPLQLAAGLVLFLLGGVAGSRFGQRDSLERALARTDLSVGDRVLLLQRAGSAYVRAAQGYADATSVTDSTAVQVASQVLLGAASAVARQRLDGGLAARLNSVLAATAQGAPVAQPIIHWY